jgi:integrase
MATIRKRGKAYQIDYFDPAGKRVRKSFKKKKDAEAELGKRVSLIAEGRYLDVKKDYKTILKELLKKYEENFKHQAGYNTSKKFNIEVIREYFGKETLLANMRYVHLETFRNHLKQKLTKHKTVRSDASVNRTLACLRHMLQKAVEWDMMEQNPFEKGKTLLFKENNQRLRYLDEDEIPKLLEKCQPHLKSIIECAINSGMRKGEILSLKWNQIKDGLIYLQKTKSNKARQIPLNDDLEDLFKRMKSEQKPKGDNVVGMDGKPVQTHNSNYVFSYKGKPVNDVKRAFNKALDDAGIQDFRFHDLRHTFASHFVMRGGSIKSLQEILGHKDIKTTMRYAHLSQEHKKKEINLVVGLTSSKAA